MTLYLLFEALRKGEIQFQTSFSVSKSAAHQMRMKLGLIPGEKISVKTLIEALIVKSANDIAVVAAEGLADSVKDFVSRMNKKAKKLGMKQTHFCNPSGVPDSHQTTTARDMAILAKALLQNFPEYTSLFNLRSFEFKGKKYRTHNHVLNAFPGADGMKTGYIYASGYNISTSVTRYDDKKSPHRLLCVFMGGNSPQERDQKVITLLEEALLKRKALFYNVKETVAAQKTGIPLKRSRFQRTNEPPIFIRAPLQTKEGMSLLLQQYSSQHEDDEDFSFARAKSVDILLRHSAKRFPAKAPRPTKVSLISSKESMPHLKRSRVVQKTRERQTGFKRFFRS